MIAGLRARQHCTGCHRIACSRKGLADSSWRLQRRALERMAELEDESAALKEAAQRRSSVLRQSRSFITAYLEVRCPAQQHLRSAAVPALKPG